MRPAVTAHVKRSWALSGTVADARNVTSVPFGQLAVDVRVVVGRQGSVMDEFDDEIETTGGSLEGNSARLLKGRLIALTIHEKNLLTGFGCFSSLSSGDAEQV